MMPQAQAAPAPSYGRLSMREAIQTDLATMAAKATMSDREEWYASTGMPDLYQALCRAADICAGSVHAAVVDDKLLAIFGCRPIASYGQAWAICTDLVHKYPKMFMRYSYAALRGMVEVYPMLVNQIDARNVRALKWAARVGFEIYPAVPSGPFKLPFHPIAMRGVVHV